jgi:hypothetical protein
VAASPRASASAASTSRVDRPRTEPAITRDSMALVRVTPLPRSRELLGGAPQLRASQRDGPGRGLDRERAGAVARPLDRLLAGPSALVAVPAEELGHLRLQGGLEQHAAREAGDLLEHLAEVPLGVEQLVNPCGCARWVILVQPSGVGPPSLDSYSSKEPSPAGIYTRGWTPSMN